jgi:hypothetical protein
MLNSVFSGMVLRNNLTFATAFFTLNYFATAKLLTRWHFTINL